MTTFGDQVFELGGKPVGSLQDPSGVTYFVDGNAGSDGNDGSTWDLAYATLAAAMAASQANIALTNRANRRNTIYASGTFVEDLVALAQKTNVIGVGSYGELQGAGVSGNHAPVDTSAGTKFYNMNFEGAAAGDIWTLVSGTTGLEFHGCNFISDGQVATSAIDSTASAYMKIVGCNFNGDFSANYIDIGAGAVDGMVIKDNIMGGGANDGIMVTGTATVANSRRGLIVGNYIECLDIIMDVNSTSLFNVIDNIGVSGEALGSSSYVVDLTFAAKNVFTGNDISVGIPSYTTVA